MFKDLKKFQAELDRYHDVNYASKVVKCKRLEKELSKSNTTSKSFEALQKHAINLELALQQCKEQIKNDKAFKENQSNVFQKEREQYFEIQDLKAQLQDKGIAISELKILIEKIKGKYVETKFEKPSVIRQPNAFKSQRQSILGKPATFSDSLAKKDFSKSKSVTTNNLSNDFSKQDTAQILSQNVKSILKNTNMIAPGMTKKPIAVPISTREHKRTVNQSVATPLKRTVASESTNQKSRSKIRKQYEQISVPLCPILHCLLILLQLIEIILFIVDSGCSKHMTGNLKLLSNFVEKFLGTVKFGNDQIAPILGYGDLVQGNITIKRVYYVEGLNHNLFSIGVSRDSGICISITLQDTSTPNPICLMAKATSSQAWLWHRRLSHLNFDTINLLSKYDIVTGLPKLKFVKDHIFSSCELEKAKRKSFHPKATVSSKRRLQILHMDLCGPMSAESFNGKKRKYVISNYDDIQDILGSHLLEI
ncbi:retrovirus-related pol polyprotein from transposon TNT 1-94 [Tanacetum coccineum]